MTNAINITKEIERINNLPDRVKNPVATTHTVTAADIERAFKYLRALKTATEGNTKKATQIKLSGKRVCEMFESKKNAYLWVRKDVYKSAQLKATKELKQSGNIEFYIAKYTTKEECFKDYEKLQEYCNIG